MRRGEARWREVLEGSGTVVYEEDGSVHGYALYEQGEGREMPRALSVPEIIGATPGAREALISFMGAFDPLMFEVRHPAPRGEPLHPFLSSSYVEARVSPEFMLRIVDVEGALRLLDRETQAPLVLEVEDGELPENAGEYTVGDGGVVRGSEAGERVALDVRQLAQLYAGYLPARQLVRHGLVRPGSGRALEILEQLFPTGDPWIFPKDHF